MAFLERLKEDIAAIMERDPAARSRTEVVLCYPGLHAVLLHRLAHKAWRAGWLLTGRSISHFARMFTGIEIHPGARIGRRLFIDHGMGCVIGQTTEIGDDVTLYHGVTLGGVSLANEKRHPTLEDNVIVGSGAQVLGPITVGAGARIGANAVVLKPVPPGVTMVGIPARQALPRQRTGEAGFRAYGTPDGGIPDPVGKAFDGLLGEIENHRLRLEALEEERARAQAPELPEIESSKPDERA
jgi:serine O-acetyltransferase